METLAEKVQKKLEADQMQVQKLTEESLNLLSENLSKHVKKKLNTISEDMDAQTDQVILRIEKLNEQIKDISLKRDKLSWLIRHPLLTIFLSVTLTLTSVIISNRAWTTYLTRSTIEKQQEYTYQRQLIDQLGPMKGVRNIVESQIWLDNKPEVWKSEEGFWVVQLKE